MSREIEKGRGGGEREGGIDTKGDGERKKVRNRVGGGRERGRRRRRKKEILTSHITFLNIA